jgi:hypothetical protein
MRVGLWLLLVALMILILRGAYPEAPRLVMDAVQSARGLLASMAP